MKVHIKTKPASTYNDHIILPMFAALEQGQIELALTLSVCPPENMRSEIFTMSPEEIKILKTYIDVKSINRASYSAINSFDFKTKGESISRDIIQKFNE